MSIYKHSLPVLLAKVVPYAAILAVGVAFVFFTTQSGLSKAINGFVIIGIPAILAAGIAIWKFRKVDKNVLTKSIIPTLDSRYFKYLVLGFIILYIFSLILLIQGGERPISYFILFALMAGIILVEILGMEGENGSRTGIILTQSTFLAINLIFGQTLVLPLFFGGGDVLFHIGFINSIIESGRAIPDVEFIIDYQYFPLFHIFGASGTLVTGMESVKSYYIFNGFAFIISIPIVYLLVRQVFKNTRFALLAALLYSLSREVLHNGMYMNTREMAFLFILLILYLLIKRNMSFRIIAVGLILPLIFLHHTTLVHFSGILILLIAIEFMLTRHSQYIGFNYVVLFTAAYLGYWVWIFYPFFSGVITLATSGGAASIPVEGVTESTGQPLGGIILASVDYSILIFFVIVGVISLLNRNNEHGGIGHVFALFTIIMLPIFIPTIAEIFRPLYAYRLSFLVSPFIAIGISAGVLTIFPKFNENKQRVKSLTLFGIVCLSILIYSFFSVFLLGNMTDQNLSAQGFVSPRRYLTQAELASLSFLTQHRGDTPIYSDHHSARALEGFFKTQASGAIYTDRPVVVDQGYLLFRKEAFSSKGILLFYSGSDTYQYTSSDTPDLEVFWQKEKLIYSDGSVQTYLK